MTGMVEEGEGQGRGGGASAEGRFSIRGECQMSTVARRIVMSKRGVGGAGGGEEVGEGRGEGL